MSGVPQVTIAMRRSSPPKPPAGAPLRGAARQRCRATAFTSTAAAYGADPRQGERGGEAPTAELGQEAAVACGTLSAGRGYGKACWLAVTSVLVRCTARWSGRSATIHVHIATRASGSAGEAVVCSRVRSAVHDSVCGPAAPSWNGPSGPWLDRRIGRGWPAQCPAALRCGSGRATDSCPCGRASCMPCLSAAQACHSAARTASAASSICAAASTCAAASICAAAATTTAAAAEAAEAAEAAATAATAAAAAAKAATAAAAAAAAAAAPGTAARRAGFPRDTFQLCRSRLCLHSLCRRPRRPRRPCRPCRPCRSRHLRSCRLHCPRRPARICRYHTPYRHGRPGNTRRPGRLGHDRGPRGTPRPCFPLGASLLPERRACLGEGAVAPGTAAAATAAAARKSDKGAADARFVRWPAPTLHGTAGRRPRGGSRFVQASRRASACAGRDSVTAALASAAAAATCHDARHRRLGEGRTPRATAGAEASLPGGLFGATAPEGARAAPAPAAQHAAAPAARAAPAHASAPAEFDAAAVPAVTGASAAEATAAAL